MHILYKHFLILHKIKCENMASSIIYTILYKNNRSDFSPKGISICVLLIDDPRWQNKALHRFNYVNDSVIISKWESSFSL